MALSSSAAVRITTFGRATSVPPMGNVMVIQAARVGALKLFPQTDRFVSQYAIKVSTVAAQSQF